jgi:subtilisin family serine protease
MRRAGRIMAFPTVQRGSAAVLGVLLAVGGTALTAPAAAAPPQKTAVIVQLKPGSDALAEARRAVGSDGRVSHVFRSVLQGFSAELSDHAIAALQRNPQVALIEPDGVMTAAEVQTGAPWGLDRIDQRALPLSGTYDFPAVTGTDVAVYIVDTGVAPTADLDQRRTGYDVITPGGDGTGDCNGHGTHVAGTVAGTTYGVAKSATIVPVRVLDCAGSGTWSGIIAGLDWVVTDHSTGPAVANMSLAGGASSSVDAAVQRVIADGVTVAVAAGNSNVNACNTSPARVSGALTVGATDNTDRRASFSNYGSCLDLFAPGVNVPSDWLAGGTKTISGTSMATPHVAGAAAVLLSKTSTTAPAAVATSIIGNATTGVVKSAGTRSPNRLLYSAG